MTVVPSARAACLTRQRSSGRDHATRCAARWSPLIALYGIRAGEHQLRERLRVLDRGGDACRAGACTVVDPGVQRPPRPRVRPIRRRTVLRRLAEGGAGGSPSVSELEHHARERDAVGDAVMHPDEDRGAGAEAVDQIDLPERTRAVEGLRQPVRHELLERRLVARRRQRHVVEVQVEVEVGVLPVRAGQTLDGPLAEAVEAVDDPLAEHITAALQSIGSSHHSTLLMIIRLVGRSMCSHAASALDMPCEVLMPDASRAVAGGSGTSTGAATKLPRMWTAAGAGRSTRQEARWRPRRRRLRPSSREEHDRLPRARAQNLNAARETAQHDARQIAPRSRSANRQDIGRRAEHVAADHVATHAAATPASLDERTARPARPIVARSRAAADAFRRIDDQEAVDRIVWALVVAGLQHAVELARLAMDEVGFGVFEDKVVKNYIATEFLYDYLKDKRSVGVIDEDAEKAIRYVAEPIGVVLALTPITNPTSTILFKAIVAAKTRNAIIFRPSARAAGCSLRAVEILREAGERAGMPPDALAGHPGSDARRLAVPLPPSRTSTSSGRRAARRRSPPPTPPASRA